MSAEPDSDAAPGHAPTLADPSLSPMPPAADAEGDSEFLLPSLSSSAVLPVAPAPESPESRFFFEPPPWPISPPGPDASAPKPAGDPADEESSGFAALTYDDPAVGLDDAEATPTAEPPRPPAARVVVPGASDPFARGQDSTIDFRTPFVDGEKTLPEVARPPASEGPLLPFSIDTRETPTPPQPLRVVAPRAAEPAEVAAEPAEGPRWPMIVLFNYASIVTILCVYFYVNRARPDAPLELPVAADFAAVADPGRRVDDAFKVTPPPPLAPERVAALGAPLRVGELEVTAVAVLSGDVQLVSIVDPKARPEPGGKGALWLKLRLHNRSADTVFAPLDEALIRDRDDALPDSFLETDSNVRIYAYPLAPGSERGIRDQKFFDLRPGEVEEEGWVVSAAGASGQLGAEATWRVRLRTGEGTTETVGFRFRRDQVEPKE